MQFWEGQISNKARKVLVIPNITNSSNIEKDSFVDVIYNHIKGLENYGEYFWNIILPKPVQKLNLLNVKQHILPFSGDMIKMRTYPPDMNKVLENVEYDVIYSHLPDWPQVGRYKNSFDTKIIGYAHWWEMKSCNAEDRKNKFRWMPIELLGVSQMETCFLNTQEQKDRVLEEAKLWFNDLFIQKLSSILVVWNLGIDVTKIIESPKPKEKVIVFNHRAAAYKGYPSFIKLMEEYRGRRQDFKVWVPQLDGKPEFGWIDNTKAEVVKSIDSMLEKLDICLKATYGLYKNAEVPDEEVIKTLEENLANLRNLWEENKEVCNQFAKNKICQKMVRHYGT
jgi:hypothetical protein